MSRTSGIAETGWQAVRNAPFGQHTRYMLASNLRHVLMVTSVLLAIALTIDLWPQFQVVATATGNSAISEIWNVIWYSMLRTPGLVAPFLPFATFLGVVWAEVIHTQSGERMLVWNSGRSPAQCLMPVILLGIILGAAEFAMDAYLGPASMSIQMRDRFGLDGQRLDRSRLSDVAWIALPNGILRAQIEYGPPPVLHDLTYFRRTSAGQLAEVDEAAIARHITGTNVWLLQDGKQWRRVANSHGSGRSLPLSANDSIGAEAMVPFAAKKVRLELNPLWLSVFGVEPQYLPLTVLRAIARHGGDASSNNLYRTRIEVLYGESLLPGAMALLASSMSLLLLAYATPWQVVVGIVFTGYLAHFGTKACLLMGQSGFIPPLVAGWFVPTMLVVMTLAVFSVIERQRRRRIELAEFSAV